MTPRDNQHTDPLEWFKYSRMREQFPTAAEKGRLLAAHEIATNPEARKRVEDTFGIDAVRAMYPEAYRYSGRFSGVVRMLDSIRDKIHW